MNDGSPLLFLSHSGADTEAARALVDRIESAPDAKKRGLKVWFDKRDLLPGRGWQQQLEEAIDKRSTAFAVYVGSTGVINWVESEVRVALSRSKRQQDYPFIPILGADCQGLDSLPAFARQYQGVQDVENQPGELAKLLRAALGDDSWRAVQMVDQPFVGLRPFGERDQHLFFGREKETKELLDRLHHNALVMVVGDSGSGKSSLVHAGLIPAFRGGGLADLGQSEPDESVWHVIKTRPRGDAFQALADDLGLAAGQLGTSAADRGIYVDWIRSRNPEKVRCAFEQGSPAGAKILLVIDQFEELLTQCEESSRSAYLDTLLHLAGDPVRIVLTMRRDYYNLCSQHSAFYDRVEQRDEHPEHPAKYTVRRIDDNGLRRCITEPLQLAGASPGDVFVDQVIQDVSNRPGDLALVEIALTESWRRRNEFDGDLLKSYLSVGGVAGALATLADEIFQKELSGRERELAEVVLLRLVRLGETGGVTRRLASRDEFSAAAWDLAQALAKAELRRLVLIRGNPGEETVELSHEALAAQWPRYQTWLQSAAGHKRIHDRLIPVAKKWRESGEEEGYLYSGRNLEEGLALLDHRLSWLSETEESFLQASESRRLQQERKRKRLLRSAIALALVSTLVSIFAFWQWNQALEKEARIQAESLFSFIGVEPSLTQAEADVLGRISRAREAVRINVLQAVFNSPSNSQRFARRREAVIHSVVALDPQMRQRVVDYVLLPYCYLQPPTEPSHVDSCVSLVPAFERISGQAINFFVSVMEKERDYDRVRVLGRALASLGSRLDAGQAVGLEYLVAAIENNARPSVLRKALVSLVGRLDARQAAGLAEHLVAAMEKEEGNDRLSELGRALGSLAGRLDAARAAPLAERLVAAMEKEGDSYRLSELGRALGSLGNRLDAGHAARGAERLVAAMENEGGGYRLLVLGEVLASFGGRLDAVQAVEYAERLMAVLEKEGDSYRLSKSLASLGSRLDAEHAARGAEHLVAAMGKEENRHQLSELRSALAPLVKRLNAERAASLAEQLLADMEKEGGSDRLSELGSALGSLGRRLDAVHAARGAEHLVTAIGKEEDRHRLSKLRSALAPLVERLDAERAAQLAERLVAAMEKEEDKGRLSELGSALGSLGRRLDGEHAARGAERLVAAMEKEGSSYWLSVLGIALGSLGGRLDAKRAARGAERLVAAMEKEGKKEGDSYWVLVLGKALGSLGGRLDAEWAARGAEHLVAAIQRGDYSMVHPDAVQLPELGWAIGPLVDRLDAGRAAGLAERLVAAMEEARDIGSLEELGRVLGLLGERLDAGRAAGLVKRLVAAMETEGGSGRLSALGMALGSLGSRLDAPLHYMNASIDSLKRIPKPRCSDIAPLARNNQDSIQLVIDVLKWPTCSSEDRDALILRIGELADVSEGTFRLADDQGNFLKADVWAFLDWAQQEGYNLSTVEESWLDWLWPQTP